LGQNGTEVRVKLDQQLSDDALALSDLFELDEADALDLVLSGFYLN
jgi:hypothetical protein